MLLGGYILERKGNPEEGQENPIEVSEPIAGPEYEQMELLETFERSEVR